MSSINNSNNRGTRQIQSSGGRSSTPLNATANAFNPQDTHRALSQGPVQDSPGSRTQHGVIGGGAIVSQTTPTTLSPPPHGANRAVWAQLATGPTTIRITEERNAPNAHPDHPAFLKGVRCNANNFTEWKNTVLPYVRKLTFVVESRVDADFLQGVFRSRVVPALFECVHKIEFTGFHWFSGISGNIVNNPYLVMASHLAELQEISFTMHTAGITVSQWSERQMIAMEAEGDPRAKARRLMSQRDVTTNYGLRTLFRCDRLVRVRIIYIKSEMMTEFAEPADPVAVLRDVQRWIEQGFRNQGQNVVVELV